MNAPAGFKQADVRMAGKSCSLLPNIQATYFRSGVTCPRPPSRPRASRTQPLDPSFPCPSQANILEDIDGDGRADYCLVHDNGEIHCFRNGGTGAAPSYWQEMSGKGTWIFQGPNNGDKAGVMLSTLTLPIVPYCYNY